MVLRSQTNSKISSRPSWSTCYAVSDTCPKTHVLFGHHGDPEQVHGWSDRSVTQSPRPQTLMFCPEHTALTSLSTRGNCISKSCSSRWLGSLIDTQPLWHHRCAVKAARRVVFVSSSVGRPRDVLHTKRTDNLRSSTYNYMLPLIINTPPFCSGPLTREGMRSCCSGTDSSIRTMVLWSFPRVQC